MSEVKHTPTPWTMGGYGGYTIYNGAKEIASVTWGKGVNSDAAKNNAAHIVKCVNLHDELVEVIQDLICAGEFRRGCEDLKAARETLKKAGVL